MNPSAADSAAPTISVLLPVYNAARYLRHAIGSILGQTFSDFEIVAVDDGSKDDSRAILEDIAARDPRVRVISRPNTGIVGALNDAIAAARGTFFARMDGDDWALPERFARQLAFLRAHPDVVCVGTAYIYMDEHGALLKHTPRPLDHAAIEAELLRGNGGAIIHPTILLRAESVRAVGGYRPAAQWIEDLDLYLRLARIGRLANLPEPLLHYRFHMASVNFTRSGADRFERKLRIMAEAYAARGLPFDAAKIPAPRVRDAATVAAEARDFATASLVFRQRRTAFRYAWRALRHEPRSAQSWKTLSYVSQAALGLIKVKAPA